MLGSGFSELYALASSYTFREVCFGDKRARVLHWRVALQLDNRCNFMKRQLRRATTCPEYEQMYKIWTGAKLRAAL